jgi:hypothetical protein
MVSEGLEMRPRASPGHVHHSGTTAPAVSLINCACQPGPTLSPCLTYMIVREYVGAIFTLDAAFAAIQKRACIRAESSINKRKRLEH